jgi:hypothetical protein
MQRAGQLKKLLGHVDEAGQVSYTLILDHEEIPLVPLIGKCLRFYHNGIIHCIACNRPIKKSFQQGYCFPCTQTLAQCDICIVRPELCHHRHGTCREPEWGEIHCMQDHYVYLANASGLKVGITRGSNIPNRWIDQGAAQALPIIRVKDRYVSGLVEVLFKQEVADKTNWRKMLQSEPEAIDLMAKRDELLLKLEASLEQINQQSGSQVLTILDQAKALSLRYPVKQYPMTIKKLDFDDNGTFSGKLLGIKGQYLLFDKGVVNVRNLVGQHLSMESQDESFSLELDL